MKQFFKIPILKLFVLWALCLLVACGNTDAPAEASEVEVAKPPAKQKVSPHTIQGMKNVMDDARGVEEAMQRHADEQRREIDNIR